MLRSDCGRLVGTYLNVITNREPAMKLVNLPHGLTISALNEPEAKVLYHEIFIQQAPLKHGIQVSDGDCVFDVGANIGLYSMFLTQLSNNLRIFAFEPIPDIFSVLQANARDYLAASNIKLFDVGLSDKSRIARFEFNPTLGFAATMYAQELTGCIDREASIYDWAKAIALDLPKISLISTGVAQFLVKILSIPLLRSLSLVILNRIVLGNFKQAPLKQFDCQLKTVSEIIREHDIAAIDLVKIDAEGSELDIVMGIEPDDWKKIEQFIVEVHDIKGRLQQMISIFESRGYQTLVDREDWEIHKLMNIYTIYAVARQPA